MQDQRRREWIALLALDSLGRDETPEIVVCTRTLVLLVEAAQVDISGQFFHRALDLGEFGFDPKIACMAP